MDKTSREGAMRLDQRVGEEPDFFVMRAFEKAIPYIDQNRAIALVEWMRDKTYDPKTWQPDAATDDTHAGRKA